MVAVSLSGFTAAGAEESSREDRQAKNRFETRLDTVVVTATRSAKELSLPREASRPSPRRHLESRNVKTVDEALNMTPGVTVTRSKGYMDTHASVYMRGFNSQPDPWCSWMGWSSTIPTRAACFGRPCRRKTWSRSRW
jgi:outer membrane cobalamin receptor